MGKIRRAGSTRSSRPRCATCCSPARPRCSWSSRRSRPTRRWTRSAQFGGTVLKSSLSKEAEKELQEALHSATGGRLTRSAPASAAAPDKAAARRRDSDCPDVCARVRAGTPGHMLRPPPRAVPASRPHRARRRRTGCAFTAVSVAICAALLAAATLVPAPAAVVPLVAVVCIGCPMFAVWDLSRRTGRRSAGTRCRRPAARSTARPSETCGARSRGSPRRATRSVSDPHGPPARASPGSGDAAAAARSYGRPHGRHGGTTHAHAEREETVR